MATLQEICQQGKGGTVSVTITEVGAVRTVNLKLGGTKNVQDLKVTDASGTAKFSIWDPKELYQPNSVITITETYGKDEGAYGWKLNQKRVGTITTGGQPATTVAPAPIPQPTQRYTPPNELYAAPNVTSTTHGIATTAAFVFPLPAWDEAMQMDFMDLYKQVYEIEIQKGDKKWALNALIQAKKTALQIEDMKLRREELKVKQLDIDMRMIHQPILE